jgi:hypothetical protein
MSISISVLNLISSFDIDVVKTQNCVWAIYLKLAWNNNKCEKKKTFKNPIGETVSNATAMDVYTKSVTNSFLFKQTKLFVPGKQISTKILKRLNILDLSDNTMNATYVIKIKVRLINLQRLIDHWE